MIDLIDQGLNPELIGANKALEEGDLERYAAIMAGKESIGLD